MKRTALVVTAVLWSAGSLLADFSYEQTSKITGGAMAGMMKFAGAFSKQAREPIKTSVMVKGDRMVNVSAQGAQVIDLGKETITHIDFQKKTYSVMTFAEFSQAIQQLGNRGKEEEGMQVTVKPSVKQTGETKNIAGFDTRQVILTIEMEGTDKKTGKPALMMTMTSDMWLASSVTGYDEVRNFYKRMSQKINWSPNMGMMAPAGSSKGMAEMIKEMSKLDGVPVLQLVKMGGPAGQPGAAEPAAGQPPQQPQQEQQAQAEEKPSAGGALGKLGGRLGGFGGFGRKKKQEQQEQAPPPATPEAAPAQQQGQGGAPGSLMEMTTELTGFSTAAVDASKFDVPAGFKQVESDMLKGRRR